MDNKYKGTKLDGTYNPIVFDANSNSFSHRLLLPASCSINSKTLAYYVETGMAVMYSASDFYATIGYQPIDKKLFRKQLNFISSIINLLTRKYELESIHKQISEVVESHKKDYENYCKSNVLVLGKMQDNIDQINDHKVIMKDYLLHDLHELLTKCGIDTSFGDFPHEHIDSSKWEIKKEYQNIGFEYTNTILGFNKLLLIAQPGLIIIPLIKNSITIRKLSNEYKKIIPIAKKNKADMDADINANLGICEALNNIAEIYKSILTVLRPIMKEILIDIERVYHCDFSKLPHDTKEVLYAIKELMKALAEKKIMKYSMSKKTLLDNLKEISDDTSLQYNQLRDVLYRAKTSQN